MDRKILLFIALLLTGVALFGCTCRSSDPRMCGASYVASVQAIGTNQTTYDIIPLHYWGRIGDVHFENQNGFTATNVNKGDVIDVILTGEGLTCRIQNQTMPLNEDFVNLYEFCGT